MALHLAAQRGVTSSPRVRSWLSRLTVVCVALCCLYRPRTAFPKQLASGGERLYRGPSPNAIERPCPTVCRGPIGRDRADRLIVVVRQLCERLDIGTDPRIVLFRGAKSRIPCRHSSQGPRESSKYELCRCVRAALESVATRLCVITAEMLIGIIVKDALPRQNPDPYHTRFREIKSNCLSHRTIRSYREGKKDSRAHGHSPYDFRHKAGGTTQAESVSVTVRHTVTGTGNQFNNSRYHT